MSSLSLAEAACYLKQKGYDVHEVEITTQDFERGGKVRQRMYQVFKPKCGLVIASPQALTLFVREVKKIGKEATKGNGVGLLATFARTN